MGASKSKEVDGHEVVRPFAKGSKGFKLSAWADADFTDTADMMKATNKEIEAIVYQDYEYPFENLAFEGGGAKGMVYVGALKILEEVGIVPKRYAGASAGAICSALFACGYTADEMKKILQSDLETLLLDHSCGLCSLLPNIVNKYGWNPNNGGEKFIGDLIAAKMGDPNLTFKQLYQRTGKELCITGVNVNMLRVDYFHPKTTPDLPIKLAVKMSMAIPECFIEDGGILTGLFQAVKLRNSQGNTDMYVDGGLLCNYPVHVYDGWWLSMKNEDCFLNRLQPLANISKLLRKKERFGSHNDKTLGFLVYSSLEQDLMRAELEERVGVKISEDDRPKHSKLYSSRATGIKAQEEAIVEHAIFMNSFQKFVTVLRDVNATGDNIDDSIDKMELLQALEVTFTNETDTQQSTGSITSNAFTMVDVEILFGVDADADHIFDDLDVDKNGKVTFDELFKFIERAGIDIHKKHQGYSRREVKSVGAFFEGVQDTLLTNIKNLFLEDKDIERTVGINTDYITTTDFKMEHSDIEFCIRQGKRATIAFLKHYVHKNKPHKKGVLEPPASIGDPSVTDASVAESSVAEVSGASSQRNVSVSHASGEDASPVQVHQTPSSS